MFLNKSVLLASITSVLARMKLIPAGTGTGTESLNPARIAVKKIPVHLYFFQNDNIFFFG